MLLGAVVAPGASGAVVPIGQADAPLRVEDLPLGLPADLDAAATILYAEDRRALTDELLQLAASDDPRLRARTALAIGRVGLPRAYVRLLDLAGDPQPQVRALAAFGLGILELDLEPALRGATRTRIAEGLIRRLNDPEPAVAVQALWSLGMLGDPVAVGAVSALLADPSRPAMVHEAALGAWWRFAGADPAVPAAHLASADVDVRFAAVTALRRLEDPDAMPALGRALEDPEPSIRAAAMRGLHTAPAGIANRYVTGLLGDDDWRVVCAALQWTIALWQRDVEVTDDAFTAVLRASANRNRHVQRLALEALAWAPPRFSVPADRIALDIRGDDPAKRSAAVNALSAGGGRLAADGVDAVREAYGMAAPPRDPGPSAVPPILARAPLEAAEVVRALFSGGEPEADGWMQILADHGPETARAEFLRQLESADPERASRAAERLLEDGAPVLQAVAGEAVARLWAAGELSGEGSQARWTDALWDAQRDLGPAGALEPRLILLDAARSVGPRIIELRASALLPDPDRVIRLWTLRIAPPPAGARATELIAEAVAPVDTGRSYQDYRRLAERLVALEAAPPRLLLETTRGSLEWQLEPAWAPLATLAYLDWVADGFYDDMIFHRVVPDFVIQAGDPTAVGYGGAPGSLRSEETPIPYGAGTVGLALAGRDTGGSQFFVVHSPQPHLTGVYPVLGRVVDGQRYVERIQPGDALSISRRD